MDSESIQNLIANTTSENECSNTKTKIYESPDNGKTIYWKYFGESEKHLLSYDKNFKHPWEKLFEL